LASCSSRIQPRSARSGLDTGGPTELGQELAHGRPIITALRSSVGYDAIGVEDEVAAELEGVAPEPSEALTSRYEPRIPQPDARIEPDAGDARAPQSPCPVRTTISVDEHRDGNVQPVQKSLPDANRLVVHDEDHSPADRLDLPPLPEHLHEVRATDQSTSVAQKAHQYGTAAKVREVKRRSVERRQDKRRSRPSYRRT